MVVVRHLAILWVGSGEREEVGEQRAGARRLVFVYGLGCDAVGLQPEKTGLWYNKNANGDRGHKKKVRSPTTYL